MRRKLRFHDLLIGLCLFLAPALSWGAVCTSNPSNDMGVWDAGGSWDNCAIAPVFTDTCIVSAGDTIYMDAAAGACGELVVNGTLIFDSGARSLTIGDGTDAGGLNDTLTVASGGELMMGAGHDLLFDVANNDTPDTTGEGKITNNGTLIAAGTITYKGGVVNDLAGPIDDWPNQQVQIFQPGLPQSAADGLAGKVLVATSGWFRWQWFDIVACSVNFTDNTVGHVCVDLNDRGAVDARGDAGRLTPDSWTPGDWGQTYSDSDDGEGGTTGVATLNANDLDITFATGFSDADTARRFLLGSRFICDGDSEVGQFCDVDGDATASLCETYAGTSCDAGAAFHIFRDNQPPNEAIINEEFGIGDEFVIIDPAEIGVVSGSRADTETPPDQDDTIFFDIQSGSFTELRAMEIHNCGAAFSGESVNCITVNEIDGSNGTEDFILEDYVEISQVAGLNVLVFLDDKDLSIRKFTIRDSSPSDADGLTDYGHGLNIGDTSAATRSQNLIFEDFRIVRLNDDGVVFSQNSDSVDNVCCSNCSIKDGLIGFITSQSGAGDQGIELDCQVTNLAIEFMLLTNVDSGGIIFDGGVMSAGEITTGYIRNSIIQNSTLGHGIGESTPLDKDDFQFNVINVIARNLMSSPSTGRINFGFNWYNSYLDGDNSFETCTSGCAANASARIQIWQPGGTVKGLIIVSPASLDEAIFIDAGYAGSALAPDTVDISDNIFVLNNASDTSESGGFVSLGGASDTQNMTFNHNVCVGFNHAFIGGGGSNRCVDTIGGSPAIHTITNNVSFDCDILGFKNGGTHTVSSDFNLAISLERDVCFSCTDGSDDLATGVLAARNIYIGDYSLGPTSTARTSLGSDGLPRGARVAGVNLAPLKKLLPNLEDLPFVNNIRDTDTDGDGIYNLFDNCVRAANPIQLDTDGDGIGDVCEF